MAIKKSLMVAGAVATIGLASAVVVPNFASAETTGSTKTSLVDKIAEKFNLNKEEVQAVFDEEREAHKAEHQAKIEEKLSTAVSEGKITEDQKTKILAKLEELRNNKPDHEELENMTGEQRREFKQQKHEELKKWMEENNIPEEYMLFKFHHGPGQGMHLEKRIEN
jgi:hypothetical protein